MKSKFKKRKWLSIATLALIFIIFFSSGIKLYAANYEYFDWYMNVKLDEDTGYEDDSEYFACTSDFIRLEQGITYTLGITYEGVRNNLLLFYYDDDYDYINFVEVWDDTAKDIEVKFVLPVGAKYIRLCSNADNPDDSDQYLVVDAIYMYSSTTDYSGIVRGYDNDTIDNATDKFNRTSKLVNKVEDRILESSNKYMTKYIDDSFNISVLEVLGDSFGFVSLWFTKFWEANEIFSGGLSIVFALSIVFFILRIR